MHTIRRSLPQLAVVASAAWLGCARAAAACPDCVPIREARAAIAADPDFWSYVLLTGLPFLIVTCVALRVHRLGPPPPRKAPTP